MVIVAQTVCYGASENAEMLSILDSFLEHAPVGFALLDRQHRYLYDREGGFEQLFALDDPDERRDLAEAPASAELLRRKRAQLIAAETMKAVKDIVGFVRR